MRGDLDEVTQRTIFSDIFTYQIDDEMFAYYVTYKLVSEHHSDAFALVLLLALQSVRKWCILLDL